MSVNNFRNLNLNFHNLKIQGMCQFWWLAGGMCPLEKRSDILFTNTNHFEFWELEIFACNVFLRTPNTLTTLTHIQKIIMWTITL